MWEGHSIISKAFVPVGLDMFQNRIVQQNVWNAFLEILPITCYNMCFRKG